ncbi:MAG: succinate dehydrogenase, cytochrome b556 subunit [Rhodospirillales bacterium]|nr:succinate dehydrogenase, cytochrome b556 subunit [Rhodospirillales bacterium]
MVARSSEGKLVRRPLSPHLQVYRWPVSMALSIGHRVTGVGLALGTLLLVWWLAAAASGGDSFGVVQSFLGSPLGVLLLLGWSAALIFHLFTGVRHLAWDMGRGFDDRAYRLTGKAAIVAVVIASLLVWLVGLGVW